MASMNTVIPGSIRKIFGKPPIMIGENPATYEELLVSVVSEAKPEGLSEYLLVKDIADAEWELVRLHSFKASMLNAAVPHTLQPNGSYGHVGFPPESIAVVRALVHQFARWYTRSLLAITQRWPS